MFVEERLVHLGVGRCLTLGLARLVSWQRAVEVSITATAVCPARTATPLPESGRVGVTHVGRPIVVCPMMMHTSILLHRVHHSLVGAWVSTHPAVHLSGTIAVLSFMHDTAAGGILAWVGPVLGRCWLDVQSQLSVDLVAHVRVTACDAGPVENEKS